MLVRSAWNELRERWRNSWQPWLEDHTGVVAAAIYFIVCGTFFLLDLLLSRKRWSWSELSWLGTLAMVFGAPVLAWFLTGWDINRRKRRETQLREQHICLHCGYDMRATPDRCPECGNRADDSEDSIDSYP